MTSPDCVFCRIARGEVPASLVHEDETAIAFRDLNPQAPVHFLVVPRRHVESLDALEEGEDDLAGHLLLVARKAAREEGVDGDGYRLVINVGERGGQTVPHLHLHVLGGRRMTWPPG